MFLEFFVCANGLPPKVCAATMTSLMEQTINQIIELKQILALTSAPVSKFKFENWQSINYEFRQYYNMQLMYVITK